MVDCSFGFAGGSRGGHRTAAAAWLFGRRCRSSTAWPQPHGSLVVLAKTASIPFSPLRWLTVCHPSYPGTGIVPTVAISFSPANRHAASVAHPGLTVLAEEALAWAARVA